MANKPRLRPLSKRADFLNLKATGQTFHASAWLLVNHKPNSTEQIRCGWTIPKQVGPAVLRNRLRRWGREYLRKWSNALEFEKGLDLNMIFKRRDKGFYQSVSHKDFDEVMDKMVARLKPYLA